MGISLAFFIIVFMSIILFSHELIGFGGHIWKRVWLRHTLFLVALSLLAIAYESVSEVLIINITRGSYKLINYMAVALNVTLTDITTARVLQSIAFILYPSLIALIVYLLQKFVKPLQGYKISALTLWMTWLLVITVAHSYQ